MVKALVPLADGFEEMEAVILIDVMRRAHWDVVAAGLQPAEIDGSRGVKIAPDTLWEDLDYRSFDLLAIPGGLKGVERLKQNIRLLEATRWFYEQGRTVAAICAGPLLLLEAGVLDRHTFTSHPGVAHLLPGDRRMDKPVVVDQNVITSQGPGTAFDFVLTLVATLADPTEASALAKAMAYDSAHLDLIQKVSE